MTRWDIFEEVEAVENWSKADLVLRDMSMEGKASFVLGGQWGSEGKGSACAWLASEFDRRGEQPFEVVTGNMGAQSGHTSVHKGVTRVAFHLPTYPLVHERFKGTIYLNGGSVIDPKILEQELSTFKGKLVIHPMAAIITDECKEAEGRADSAQTKIASTRKGVGEAIARKVMRSGLIARDYAPLKKHIGTLDLNQTLRRGGRVLVEIPQGVGLSLSHSGFYPHTTSRDCTPMMALSDAGIHPSFYGATMLVLRTYPIRVGNIVQEGETLGESGGHFPDQEELSWEDLGVTAEITTVTKRVRRVFTFSKQQLRDVMGLCRPDVVMVTFCNYVKEKFYMVDIDHEIWSVANDISLPPPRVLYQFGPSTADIREEYEKPPYSL